MQSQLLIIENPPCLIHNHVSRGLIPDLALRCELTDWDSRPLEQLERCHPKLLVAVAMPLLPQAIKLFEWLNEHPVPSPTLAVLSSDVNEEVLGVVSRAADDFLLWPSNKVELQYRLWRMVGSDPKRDELESAHDHLTEMLGMEQLVGKHPAFIHAIKTIPLIAKSDLPVLITGPTGTGKELCARAIHVLSKRRDFPFIPLDAGSMPDHLFENELFGHARGAFTDAHSAQKGLAAMAEGGTLFLDEVDALSHAAQAKLLRFLQERTYKPLGGDRFVKASVNIIAATNRDLELSVKEKQFRADLYFRLNALRLDLPSLRNRRSDIPLLARHFLRVQDSPALSRKSFTSAALRKLEDHSWPGNVRELFNIVQRAALFAEGQYILPTHLSVPSAASDEHSNAFRDARNRAIEAFEKEYVQRLLEEHNGCVTKAAQAAGKDRRAFGRLKKKYGLSGPRQRGGSV